MKKVFISATLLLGAAGVFAQSGVPPEQSTKQVHQQILKTVLGAGQAAGTRPTGLGQRLTGIKLDDDLDNPPQYQKHDTTGIYYSGGRGSVFNYGTLTYNTDFHATDGPLAEGLSMLPAGTDELNPDSLTYENSSGYDERYAISYTGGNRENYVSFMFNGNTQGDHHAIIYDNSNHITGIEYGSGSPVPFTVRTIKYNTGYTRITSDSLYYVGTNELLPDLNTWTYTYDSEDRVTELIYNGIDSAGSVMPYSRYVFTYYPDSRLKSLASYGGLDDPQRYDSFAYDGSNPVFKAQYVRDYDPFGGALSSAEIKHFDVNGLPDKIYFFITSDINPNPDAYVSYATIAYNALNNPVSKQYYLADAAEPFRIYKFYYENYETSITGLVAQQDNVTLYPNPVGSTFTIEWSGAAPLSHATIILLDNRGVEVVKTKGNLNPGSNRFAAGTLSQGSYLLIIQAANGTRIVKKMVKV